MSNERYTLSLLHAPVQRDGGAQVYTGTLAHRLEEQGRLHALVSPHSPRNDFDLLEEHIRDFTPLPLTPGEKDWARYSSPHHIDYLAEQIRNALAVERRDEAENMVLYSQYVTAFLPGIIATDSMRGVSHIAMAHTWQDSTNMVGTGSVEDVLRANLGKGNSSTARDYIPERRNVELEALNRIPWFIIPTEQERIMIAQLYENGDNPAQKIYDKFLVVPLGVEQRFHDIGETIKQGDAPRRELVRSQAKNRILSHLKKNNMEEEARKLEQIPEDATVFYTVGRWKAGKGIENALKAFIEMKAQVYVSSPQEATKLAMLFCGPYSVDEPVYKVFMQIIDDIGDEGFRQAVKDTTILTNAMDGYEAAALGHVFVGPSDNESCYLVLQEAMAAGNAAVVTDYPTIRDTSRYDMIDVTCDDEFDLRYRPQLINPRDTAQFAQALDIYRDPLTRLNNGLRNAHAARDYTVERSTNILRRQLRKKGIIR